MIPISILLPRQHFWSRRAIKTRAVDTPIGSQSWSRPFDPTASVPACVDAARQRDLFGFFLFLRFIRSLLCLTSSPAVHKHTTHPAALSLSLSRAPSAPALYLRLSCLEPFPSLSLSLPPLLPARRGSAKAANVRRAVSDIRRSSQKEATPLPFIVSSLFLWGVLEGGGCWRG